MKDDKMIEETTRRKGRGPQIVEQVEQALF
jgi:hypothetical protein